MKNIVVQSLNHFQLFANPWTATRQASLSFTVSQGLLKLISIDLVMPSNHLILCHLFLSSSQCFPASGCFPMSRLFASSGQSIGALASASVLPVNIQGWFPLGLTHFDLLAVIKTKKYAIYLENKVFFSRKEKVGYKNRNSSMKTYKTF